MLFISLSSFPFHNPLDECPPALRVAGICWSPSQPSLAKAGLHPVQVANSSQDHTERETNVLPFALACTDIDNLEFSVLWMGAGKPGENPCRRRENMQTPRREATVKFSFMEIDPYVLYFSIRPLLVTQCMTSLTCFTCCSPLYIPFPALFLCCRSYLLKLTSYLEPVAMDVA